MKSGGPMFREWWAANSNELIIQHLNRKQNKKKQSYALWCEDRFFKNDLQWKRFCMDWYSSILGPGLYRGAAGIGWITGRNFFGPVRKTGGDISRISRDGKKKTKITNSNYDVMDISTIDEKDSMFISMHRLWILQKYLCRTKLDGSGSLEMISPENQRARTITVYHNRKICAA